MVSSGSVFIKGALAKQWFFAKIPPFCENAESVDRLAKASARLFT